MVPAGAPRRLERPSMKPPRGRVRGRWRMPYERLAPKPGALSPAAIVQLLVLLLFQPNRRTIVSRAYDSDRGRPGFVSRFWCSYQSPGMPRGSFVLSSTPC